MLIITVIVCLALGPWTVYEMFETLDAEMALSEQASLARR